MSLEDLLRALQAFDHLSIFPIDTPYTPYTSSNYAASDMEIPLIRNILSQYREQLNVIDTILKQIKSTVHKLSDKRKQIASSMEIHKGFISCIRRLPSDVLSHISMQCLPDATYLTPDIGDAPLLLTQICRRWREVALGTPRLWCSLYIADIRRDSERLLAFYQGWLEKSGRCPLSLAINLTSRFVSEQRRWPAMAMEFLRLYTSRCTALRIYPHSACGLDPSLGDVPNLERLYLRGSDTIGRGISIVQPRPRLHTLVIISPVFTTETLAFFNPGWTNLTRLAVSLRNNPRPPDNTTFLTLLQMFPNLEDFVFSPVFVRTPDNPITLIHSKLRMLGIRPLTGSTLSPLDTLIFPNLRRLLVDSRGDAEDVLNDTCMPEESLPDGRRPLNMTVSGLFGDIPTQALFTVFNPGWMGLTHLRLDVKRGTIYCLRPLQFCPQLEDMAVSILTVVDDHPYTLPAHHTLSSLTLDFGRGSIDIFLDALTLPSLHHLNLTMVPDWPHPSFTAFLSRSHCPLEMLDICAGNVSKVGREEFTSLIPTLRQLDLYDTSKWLVDASA